MKIKSVWLLKDGEGREIYYEVGKNGVTEIRRNERNGEMARIDFYEIYKGDKLVSELHHYSEIKYFEK
jgi:ribosomal protein L15